MKTAPAHNLPVEDRCIFHGRGGKSAMYPPLHLERVGRERTAAKAGASADPGHQRMTSLPLPDPRLSRPGLRHCRPSSLRLFRKSLRAAASADHGDASQPARTDGMAVAGAGHVDHAPRAEAAGDALSALPCPKAGQTARSQNHDPAPQRQHMSGRHLWGAGPTPLVQAASGHTNGDRGLTRPPWCSHMLGNHGVRLDGRPIWPEPPHSEGQIGRYDRLGGWRLAA